VAAGIEKLHPFDACKFRKVVAMLEKQGLLKHQQLVTPLQVCLFESPVMIDGPDLIRHQVQPQSPEPCRIMK
jgi:hypothetical protein